MSGARHRTWAFRLRQWSAEEVAVSRHDEVGRATVACEVPHTTHDGGRDPRRLAHHELGGAGDLVRDRDRRALELVADPVALALEVEEHREPRRADRDV